MIDVKAIWSAVGPLLGVFVGAYLTKRGQREQWQLDNELQEYREVLDALSTAHLALKKKHDQYWPINRPPSLEQQETMQKLAKEAQDAENESFRILADRIFIANAMQSAQIEDSWRAALSDLDASSSIGTYKFSQKYAEMHRKVRDLALLTVRGNSDNRLWRILTRLKALNC